MNPASLRIFFTAFLLLSYTILFAQSQKIDSLVDVLKNATPKDSILTCQELTTEWVDVDNRKALHYAELAYHTSGRVGDSVQLSKSLMFVGILYRRFEKMDTAIQIYESIIPYMKRNKIDDQLIFIHSSLGGIYLFMGKYDQSLKNYDLALKSPAIEKAPNVRRTIMFNTGLLYYKLFDPDRALEYNFKTLVILRESKTKKEIDQLLLNISLCYIMKKDFKSAEYYIDQALKECGGSCTEHILMQGSYNNGMLSLERGNLSDAEKFFKKADVTARALEDGRFQLDVIERLCEIYNRQKRFPEAKQLLVKADSLIPLYLFGLEKEKIYKQYINLYRETSDYKLLSEYQQKFIELQDSSFGLNLATKLMKVEGDYQQREAAAKMETQAEVIALKDTLLNWHRIVIAMTTVTLVLLAVLLVLAIRGNRRRKNANILLEEKVKERTAGFSSALSELGQVLSTRDEKTKKILTEAGNAMRAIEALCSLAKGDDENREQYLDDIRKVSLKVNQHIEVFQKDKVGEERVKV